jgi:HPt (histidine-containing phosphotransfer) domain-containing protein
MNDWLTKPINKTLLFKLLEKWIPDEKIVRASVDSPAPKGEQPVAAGAMPSAPDFGETEAAAQEEFWRKIGQIEEISVETGLDRVSGQRGVYERSLELTIKEIEKCDRNLQEFLAAGNLRNFSIEAHSMKGSLANIGAMGLSSRALALEAAADNADAAFCAETLPSFLDDLRGLKSKLVAAFAKKNENYGPIEIPPELPPIFARLTSAFAQTDFLAIDKGMESLNALNASGALKDQIERIKDAVMMMEYEEAAQVMQEMLK